MKITAKTKICMSIGDPIEQSISPEMHNAGYEKLGIDNEFAYVACRVNIEQLEDCIKGVRAMNIRGVSCTMPHKLEVMKYLDEIDEVAQKIGAVNTVVNDGGRLKGFNTDWLGIVLPIEKLASLDGKKVGLIGAGGAARAAAYGITIKGAKLTIFNRTVEKAQELAEKFGGETRTLEGLNEIADFDILINATPAGMGQEANETPIDKKIITAKHIVFDAVYNPYETRLLKEAKEQGAQIIHGADMFVQQGAAQFKLYTGYEAPVEVMRNALLEQLNNKN